MATSSSITEGFISRGVERAEAQGASLIIVQLDTPGTLYWTPRGRSPSHLINAELPSDVYETPRWARAASAGTFIVAAATFAVIAPGTNIGAASLLWVVVARSFQSFSSPRSPAMQLPTLRTIADLRNRNQEKLEATVLQALSFTGEEAVESGMVDFIAGDLDDLLAQLHGREAIVQPPAGPRLVLEMQGVGVQTMEMSLVERFLSFLSDPNVSYMLLSLGSLGIFLELLSPGLIVPGLTGTILLILSFVTLGNLPVNWAGVVLILLAVILAVLEFYVVGFGVLGVGAIVSFILGGVFLFFHTGAPSPTMPHIGVSRWVLVSTALMLSGGGAWTVTTMIRSRRGPLEQGVASLVGQMAVVATDLVPRGTVRLDNQLWTAVSQDGELIGTGEKVEVVKVDGIILTVIRPTESGQPMEPAQ